jgi:hypothetical protein
MRQVRNQSARSRKLGSTPSSRAGRAGREVARMRAPHIWKGLRPVLCLLAAAVAALKGNEALAATARALIAVGDMIVNAGRPLIKWARGGIVELLDAGLVTAGEELVWNRRNLGVRHTACVRVDGTLILADGRVFANPCGATAALGGNHQNGWNAFGGPPMGAHWAICERNSARGTESRHRSVGSAVSRATRRHTADPAGRRNLAMTPFESTVDYLVLRGARRSRPRLHHGGCGRAAGPGHRRVAP